MKTSPTDAEKVVELSHAWQPPLSFFICFSAVWGYLIFHLSSQWINDPQYSYGLFVPLFCVAVLWLRRDEWIRPSSGIIQTGPLGFPWLVYFIVIFLLPMELWRQSSPGLRAVGFAWYLLCCAFSIWSIRAMAHSKVPGVIYGVLLLFATALPWPTTFEVSFTLFLKRMVTAYVTDILNFLGILAVARGSLIQLDSGMVNIDEACSGVRSLQSCLMTSVALGLFFKLRKRAFALLILLGLVLAVVGNLIRTLILSSIVALRGPSAFEKAHDPAGWTILLGVTLILYWTASRWKGKTVILNGTPSPLWRRFPSMQPALFLAVLSFLLAHAWFWVHDNHHPMQSRPLIVLKPEIKANFEELKIPQKTIDFLQPESWEYLHNFSERLGEVAIYQFFWHTQTDNLLAVFHRPDFCMIGSGWELKGEVRRITVSLPGRKTEWYLFHFERGDERMLQAWSVWRDGMELNLEFSRTASGFWNQLKQQWGIIKQGRRITNTEIVSVLVDGRFSSEQTLKQIIQDSFVINTGTDS